MKLAYEEMVDFLASAPSPERIVKHKASARSRARLAELIDLSKNGQLGIDDKEELDNYLQLEHIMRLAKAKAMVRLQKAK